MNTFRIALLRRGDECGIERMFDAERRIGAHGPEFRQHALEQRAGLVAVLEQDADHLLHRDVVVVGMPAIVIGHHGDERVGQLGLAGELGFGHRRHADHRAAPAAIEIGFGERRELRTFHGEIGAAGGAGDAFLGRRLGQGADEPRADRMGERDVRHEAVAEKAFVARMRPVDELVGEDEMAGRQLLAERAAGRDRDHVGDARPLQRVDIGAVIDRGRRMDMAAPMTRQENEIDAREPAEQKRVRRFAPGRFDRFPTGVFKPADVIDARSADDAENGFGHDRS